MSEYSYRAQVYVPKAEAYELLKELPGYPKGTIFRLATRDLRKVFISDKSDGYYLFREVDEITMINNPKWFKPL